MVGICNAILLLLAGWGIMPFPGATYTGRVISKERPVCQVWLWDGVAPKLSALDEEEKRRLETTLKEIEEKWVEAHDWPSKARLLKPYLNIVFPKTASMFEQHRDVKYQSFAISCGSVQVRGAQALFSFLEGGILVLGHPVSGAYLIIAEYQPQAEEQRRLLAQFFNQYRAELERAEAPESLPAPIQKEYIAMQAEFEVKETKRVRFWDVNGILLPACPGQCPQGTIRYAVDQLSQEARDSLTAALSIYDAVKSNIENEESPATGGGISAVLETWPSELGKNPWLGATVELKRTHSEKVTFSPPPPEIAQRLWGTRRTLFPEFDSDLNKIIRVMRKSLF